VGCVSEGLSPEAILDSSFRWNGDIQRLANVD